MTAISQPLRPPTATSRRSWLLPGLALGGVAWNLFGVLQFVQSLLATSQTWMTKGLRAEQVALYQGLPGWMSVAFGIGVVLGLAGSLALGLRQRMAEPLLAISLAACTLLFLGDAAYGVFAAIPAQLGIMIVVLAMASVLWITARNVHRAGQLV